jgi:ribosomal protein L29
MNTKIEPKIKLTGTETQADLLKLLAEKRQTLFQEALKLKLNKSEHRPLSGKLRKNIARILTALNAQKSE